MVKKMERFPDIQNSNAEYNTGIDKVGIINVIKRIRIKQGSKFYDFSGRVSAFIDLHPEMRGIHMSRNPESIEEVLNEFQFKKATNFEMFVRKISETLLQKNEYSNRSEVILEGPLILEVAQDFGGTYQKSLNIMVKAVSTRSEQKFNTVISLRVSCKGMTSCPCAQEMVRDYSKEMLLQRASKLNLAEDVITQLLNLIPLATHSQRGQGTIEVEEFSENIINISDLIEIIEQSMSAPI